MMSLLIELIFLASFASIIVVGCLDITVQFVMAMIYLVRRNTLLVVVPILIGVGLYIETLCNVPATTAGMNRKELFCFNCMTAALTPASAGECAFYCLEDLNKFK